MAFPNAIANEPPPCMSSEDEDSEEFHSHGLKLDVPSGEPTPVSTPLKKPKQTSKSIENTSEEGSLTFVNNNSRPTSVTVNSDTDNEKEDLILEVISTSEETSNKQITSNNHLQSVDLPKENGTASSPELSSVINEFSINGTETELPVKADKVVTLTNHELTENGSIKENHASLRQDSEDTDGSSSVAMTSASEPETANEICDTTANNEVSETNQSSGHCEHVDPSSPTGETNCENIGSINEVQQIEQNELCDNYDKVQTPSPSSPHIDFLEDKAEGSSEIQEDFSTSITADPEFLEFQVGSSNSAEVHEPSSPSKDEAVTTTGTLAEQTDDLDEYDDFGAFQSIPNTSEQEHGPDLGTSSVEFDDEEDDDFGDFAQVPVQRTTAEASVKPQPAAQRTVDDSDFADFQDCSFQSFGAPMLTRRHSSTSSDIALISSKVDSIVKSLFVADSLPDTDVKLKSIDSEISISNDQVWTSVQDFEGSQGLAFKWGNSLTEKRLLRSLNIDNSNIMYHEKWGTIEVPKFAASLVMSPLQPQSCNSNLADSDVRADSRNFTVNNNNLKEGISCQDQDKPPSISAEAQEILRQLPDLSYMRANTLVFPQTSPSGI